jgi:hypothetical protein
MTPLEAAGAYLARGWSVVPVLPGAKAPPMRWAPLQRRRPEQAELAGWWQRWPGAGVAVITGAISGLVVLDIDPGHGGDDALAALEADHGPVPATASVATGGGGRHLYLAHPGGRVPNSTGRLGPGLDVRGDGGLATAPPSRHRSGRAYAWADAAPPARLPATPAWLAARLHPAPPAPRPAPPGRWIDLPRAADGRAGYWLAALDSELRRLGAVPVGQRNPELHRAAVRMGQLAAQGAPLAVLTDALCQAGLAIGLEAREVPPTVRSGLAYGLAHPRRAL